MEIVVYSQYYRTRTPDRQLEIDECLRRNLNHPGISRVVLFCESDAPPVPQGTVPVEVVVSDERITYAEWFRWVRRQGTGIGLLLNADIYLDKGLEHLATTFDRADTFLALTRYNPGPAGFHLNDYPHWTQDVWGVRGDAELPESLLYASSFPLGFPGCDNRIAYVMWSHGFRVRNPCYHVRSVHLQASTARDYHKTSDRLYGGVSYVHPSLAPDEEAELEFTLWTRSEQRPAGVLINQQAIERGVHQLRHGEAEVAQRFLDQQQFTGLSWVHEAVGSAHLQGDGSPFASEDTVFLPMTELLGDGVELRLKRPTQLEGLTMRLPRRASAGHQLTLQAEGEGVARLDLQGDRALALKQGGERRFWQPAELKETPWCKLRLKLTGAPAAAEPAWRPEEGAELVLFGEEGALAEAKSLNVIAEPLESESSNPSTTETAQAERVAQLLRTIQFADSEFIELRNVVSERSCITGPDGSSMAAVITIVNGASAVKYAFNQFNTAESGAYTASVVIKAGSHSRIVLRINDQTGANDARQTFDLAKGLKAGLAINSGSATGASSAIESLGDGWYRCSVAAVFEEPVSFLQAPSVWFEHYAPSTSVGDVYTVEASVFKGVCLPSPGSSSSAPSPSLSNDRFLAADLIDAPVASEADLPAYCWRRRSDCHALLSDAQELHIFGNRFRVLRSGNILLFDDRFWPSLGISPIDSLPCGLEDGRGLLLWGFGQAALELRPGFIANTKRFGSDVNFWQYPCRTEGDAFAVHQSLVGPQIHDGELQVYVGLPWATWIDRSSWPTSTLQATAERIRKLRIELHRFGIGLKIHSVCQHILWRENLHLIKASGVGCLWLSHKPPLEDVFEAVELRAWHLYPVNAREPERRGTLVIKPMAQRPWLASFIGAHMDHYITDVRLRLMQFRDLHRFHIAIKDEWHFNPIVYGEQVEDRLYRNRSTKVLEVDFIRYNLVLSDSQFSLCPAGAGPNSLRLWESLAVGSIPVILSDHLDLPDLDAISEGRWSSWEDIVLLHPEAELESLPQRLEQISPEELERRSAAGIAVMELANSFTCVGARSNRFLEPLTKTCEPDTSKPLIVIPVYGPTDRYYWRQKKHGFYDVVLQWYLRGFVRIRFGEEGFFWWGSEGEVLLMERDLVVDLFDRKMDPPRWEGEVPYKHAFFFNQYHLDNSRNHKATYFTYAPLHLEQMRQRLGRKSWIDRRHASIFAGSIENEVQEFFRNRFKDWEDVIEIFSCADKLNHKEAHKYSVDDYLDLVAHSRFGVSFRGNGPKCFREMEYLAFGTPLIITEGIEVDYPEPLIEGVHFLSATKPEDILSIAESISQDTWERMSLACWEWFERNGTLDHSFESLSWKIKKLILPIERHHSVHIAGSRVQAAESLAVQSLVIVDPQATWTCDEDTEVSPLVLQPDDLVINELPLAGHETAYTWKLEPKRQPLYTESILNSGLNVHKRLLELLGLRLRNFRISLSGPSGKISLWDRIANRKLVLRTVQEKAILSIDYDWTRRCRAKYVDRQIVISGPGQVGFPHITATLAFLREGEEIEADLSSHFNDYYCMHEELIPHDQVGRICKFWQYGAISNLSITGSLHFPDSTSIPIHMSNLSW